jgi:ribose transport system substrate-binding protein
MIERLGGPAKIVALRGIPCTVDTDRYEGAMEVFSQHPEVEILASQPALWSRQVALEVMQSYLTQFEHIDAVWGSDDDMALGAEQAIKEAGRADEMWILGGAGMKDVVKRVMERDPMIVADVTYPPAMIAAGIHIAVANLRDGGDELGLYDKIPRHLNVPKGELRSAAAPTQGQRHIVLDVFLITPETAEEYYFPESVY